MPLPMMQYAKCPLIKGILRTGLGMVLSTDTPKKKDSFFLSTLFLLVMTTLLTF